MNLNEAFKQMDELNEEAFDLRADTKDKLQAFLDGDIEDDTRIVIDPEAETEMDLDTSYIGKVILECPVCKSLMYKEPETVEIENDNKSVEEVCPYCANEGGFTIVGQVCDYCKDCEENSAEEHDEVKPVEEFASNELTEEVTDPRVKQFTPEKYCKEIGCAIADITLGGKSPLTVYDADTGIVGVKYTDGSYAVLGAEGDDFVNTFKEMIAKLDLPVIATEDNDLWTRVYNELDASIDPQDAKRELKAKRGERYDGQAISTDVNSNAIVVYAPTKEDFSFAKKVAEHYGVEISDPVEDKNKATNSYYKFYVKITIPEELTEDFKKVEIETDKQKMEMESDDDGKVTVTTEPVKEEAANEEEVIAPVSDAIKDKIKAENDIESPEYEDVDIEEFDDDTFDELGESYLKNVYDNVESFKTTSGSVSGNRMMIEGKITFKSGKVSPTKFFFEADKRLKNGKYKFVGSNKQLTENKKAFTLTGKVEGKKYMIEAFTYDYFAKDAATKKSKQIYATIRTKK